MTKFKFSHRTPMDIIKDHVQRQPEILFRWFQRRGYLHNISELALCGMQLQTLPDFVTELSTLKVLNLSHNSFEVLPANLKKIPNLEILILNGNPIKEIQGLDNLPNIQVFEAVPQGEKEHYGALYNHSCHLQTLIERSIEQRAERVLGKLIQDGLCCDIRELDLSHCDYKKLPRWLTSLPNLTSLNLLDNDLENLNGIEALSALALLNVRENPLFDVTGVELLTHLKQLDLSDTFLRNIPKIHHHVHVDLTRTKISNIPSWLHTSRATWNMMETPLRRIDTSLLKWFVQCCDDGKIQIEESKYKIFQKLLDAAQ